ncbi:MAG TPA: hypothetical protein VHC19_16915 [Pirellulales bacterium]|nr:hypothetical protein [Pirellulales bacterium]
MIDRQPRITDLVPQRYGIIALLFLAGVTVVVGLETLYAYMPDLAHKTADGTIAAFDLAGEGSLAVWFSSSTLLLASLAAAVVYSIRRHKADDYHGRYRIWLWSAGCWLVMSMDETGSLHEGFKELMSYASGQRGLGDGSIWWVGAYALVLGAVGTRLLLEMRECRGSTTALVLTAACYVTAVAARLGFVMPEAGAREVMLKEGCEMAGNLFLLLSMTLHARYVILDAQGLIAPRPAKAPKPAKVEKPTKAAKTDKAEKKPPAESEAPAAAASGRSWFRKTKIDPAHNNPPAPKQQPAKTAPPVAAGAKPNSRRAEAEDEYDYDEPPRGRQNRKSKEPVPDDADSDSYGGQRRMTKAERKALRRGRNRQHEDEE